MARQVVAEFDAITGPFLRKMNQIDGSVRRFERRATTGFARVETSMNRMVAASSRLSTFTNAIAAGLGAREVTRFIDSSKRIRNALREAGDESEETYDMVYKSSVRALAGFEATAQGVLRFQKALLGRQGIEQTNRDLETLNKLLALSGKTAQERSSTMIQFSQALQAGYLGGEELRAIRENAPIDLVRAIAREAGGSISDLKDLSAEYKLTTDVMVRALQSLEEEADRRFADVYVTFQDAANVLQSGAIRAVEGLDKGLGFSEAIIVAMKEIGELLGENAGLAEGFGNALQLGVASMASGFIANRGYQAFQRSRRAAPQNAAIAEQDFAAARRQQQIAEQQYRTAVRATDALVLQGASAEKVAKANDKQSRSLRKLNAARDRSVAALNAVNLAQKQTLFGFRALTAASTVLRGAFNFLGGWPGLIIGAGLAFLQVRSNIRATAEELEALKDVSVGYESNLQTLKELQEQYNEARNAGGSDGQGALATAANIAKQIELEKATRERELREMQEAQAERVRARLQAQEDLRAALDEETRIREEFEAKMAQIDREAEQGVRRALTQEERDKAFEGFRANILQFEQNTRDARDSVQEWDVAIAQALLAIQAYRDALSGGLDVQMDAVAAEAQILAFIRENMSAREKEQEILDAVTNARQAYVESGEASADVLAQLDAAIARYIENMSDAEAQSNSGAAAFIGAANAARQLGAALNTIGSVNLNLDERLENAQRIISQAEAGASKERLQAIRETEEAYQAIGEAGRGFDQAATAYINTLEKAEQTVAAEKKANALLRDAVEEISYDPAGGGGSGGGSSGKSKLTEDLEEAARFVESMMTDEERRAQTVAEITAIYQNMVAALGENDERVRALGEAMERYKDETMDAMVLLNDGLAQAVVNGNNFLDIIGRIIGRLIEMNGVKAFEALFAGDGLGQFFKVLVGAAANGAIVNNGTFQKFASGGIVSAPTYFPMKGGVGLMGEAGPEAIVPLPDGRSIPVSVQNSSMAPEMEIHVHENAVEGGPQVRMSNGGQRLDVFLRKAVAGAIESGGADKAMASRYNVKPKPIGG